MTLCRKCHRSVKFAHPDGVCLVCRSKPESNAAADAFLYPGGGGIAVWVRRDEMLPRVAVRFRTDKPEGENVDIEQTMTLVAMLSLGVERLQDILADTHNAEREAFKAAVKIAADALRDKVNTMSEVRRGSQDGK